MLIHEEDAKSYTKDKKTMASLKGIYGELAKFSGHSIDSIRIRFADDAGSLDGWSDVEIRHTADEDNRLIPLIYKAIERALDMRLLEVANCFETKYDANKRSTPWTQLKDEERAELEKIFIHEPEEYDDLEHELEIASMAMEMSNAMTHKNNIGPDQDDNMLPKELR